MTFGIVKILILLGTFLELVQAENIGNTQDDNVAPGLIRDVGCGEHSLDPSISLQFQSPYFQQGIYPANYECTWKFFGTSGCNPSVNCEDFDVPNSPNCTTDFLSLSDGSGESSRFCGTKGPSQTTSSSSLLYSYFKSGSSSVFKNGFRCTVTCSSPSELRFPINFLPTSPPKYADCLCGVTGDSSGNGTRNRPEEITRIVNGTVAPKYRWKWQAAMVLRGSSSPFCGASLITDRHILTAAHCVVTTGLAVFPAAAEIVLNDYNISSSDETVTIRRNIIAAIPHPQYNPATQDYDIAVIEMSQPVDLTATQEPKVTPVCLPSKGARDLFVCDIATVTGWGTTTEGGEQPDVLMQVDVPVITNELCNMHYDNRITPRMICAGYPDGGQDSCQGDSGGPFVLPGPDGRYTEIGVVSFGQGCARAGKEGVYARVTELNDWVRSTARGATWCKEQ